MTGGAPAEVVADCTVFVVSARSRQAVRSAPGSFMVYRSGCPVAALATAGFMTGPAGVALPTGGDSMSADPPQ